MTEQAYSPAHVLRYVYLAGPVTGQTREEANAWRYDFARRIERATFGQVRCISPLRKENLLCKRYEHSNPCPKFGMPRAIAAKNRQDVRNCDVTLAYLPDRRRSDGDRPSYGTICEIVWAAEQGKMVIVISDDPEVKTHPVILECCGWMLETFDEAIEVITGLLGDYCPERL